MTATLQTSAEAPLVLAVHSTGLVDGQYHLWGDELGTSSSRHVRISPDAWLAYVSRHGIPRPPFRIEVTGPLDDARIAAIARPLPVAGPDSDLPGEALDAGVPSDSPFHLAGDPDCPDSTDDDDTT